MSGKEIVLSLKDVQRKRHEAKLEMLRLGLPIRRKRSFPRDPEKRKALLEWLLEVTPPAKDILSGKAFSERFRKNRERENGSD